MENLALNVIENVASASALIAFQGPLSSKKEVILFISHSVYGILLQEPGEGVCLCVCGVGGSTWRSNSRNSGKADIRTVSTAWSMLCPHSRLGPGTCGSWAKHLVPRARSHLEEARAFSLSLGWNVVECRCSTKHVP